MSASYDEFQAAGAEVLEISADSLDDQKKWSVDLGGIEVPLMSDTDPKGDVATAYGVFNNERGRARRSSFVIDKDGVIRDVRVYPPGSLPSPAKLLEVVKGL